MECNPLVNLFPKCDKYGQKKDNKFNFLRAAADRGGKQQQSTTFFFWIYFRCNGGWPIDT